MISSRRILSGPTEGWPNVLAATPPAHNPDPMLSSSPPRSTRLIVQPDFSPISLEELAAEIKGIYAGLVRVEAKCMSVDESRADDPKSRPSPEEWQALIALHRTLLYEHHDFLMASQHPIATEALRDLATKHSMPARMWRHGIHSFLDILRHRLPASHDYMLSFIYLAYQMMALFLETVPSFTDTWTECLGDLARYRMAVEEQKEARAAWGKVATRWYTLLSDRLPTTGRLYHHLGVLEMPGLRKLSYYAISLTCVLPCANARGSLSALCASVAQDQRFMSYGHSIEARIVTFYALNFSHGTCEKTDAAGTHALELLRKSPSEICTLGAHLCVASISALFDFGELSNPLLQLYLAAVGGATQSSRNISSTGQYNDPNLSADSTNTVFLANFGFLCSTFELVVQRLHLLAPLRECLPYVHIMLVWLHSIYVIQHRLDIPIESFPLDLGLVNWQSLAGFLDRLIHEHPVTDRILESARARRSTFTTSEYKDIPARPLPEDNLIRGLVWGHFYFPSDWFNDQTEEDGRAIEDAYTGKARAERVLWLGVYLAVHTQHLQYDAENHVFEVGQLVSKDPATQADAQLNQS